MIGGTSQSLLGAKIICWWTWQNPLRCCVIRCQGRSNMEQIGAVFLGWWEKCLFQCYLQFIHGTKSTWDWYLKLMRHSWGTIGCLGLILWVCLKMGSESRKIMTKPWMLGRRWSAPVPTTGMVNLKILGPSNNYGNKRFRSHPRNLNPYEENRIMERNGDRRRLSKLDFLSTNLLDVSMYLCRYVASSYVDVAMSLCSYGTM